jgi:threonine aldolase
MLDAQSPQFASDNNAGICPEALAALVAANRGHAPGYGADDWTRAAHDAIRAAFDIDCDVYLVFNGTAANSLALASICRSTDAIICSENAHINVDECGAPEFFSGGAKVITARTPHAKLVPEQVAALGTPAHDEHGSRPRALALTQATEFGTVYTPREMRALCEAAHSRGMKVQLDGARFANAVASLGCAPADISWRAGIDVLCLGGTKNGLPFGEAIVFFDRALADEFLRRRKQGGQLASKMRFLAAPWSALMTNGVWLKHAAHANAMARRLAAAIEKLPGVTFIAPVEANGVFADLPVVAIDAVRASGWRFYHFVGATGVRFMCAWDTPPELVDRFAADIAHAIESLA